MYKEKFCKFKMLIFEMALDIKQYVQFEFIFVHTVYIQNFRTFIVISETVALQAREYEWFLPGLGLFLVHSDL